MNNNEIIDDIYSTIPLYNDSITIEIWEKFFNVASKEKSKSWKLCFGLARYYEFKHEYDKSLNYFILVKDQLEQDLPRYIKSIQTRIELKNIPEFITAELPFNYIAELLYTYDALGNIYSMHKGNNNEAQKYFESGLFLRLQDEINPFFDMRTYRSPFYYSFRQNGKYLNDDIKTNTITLSKPSMFNDPFDCPINTWLEYKYKVNPDSKVFSPMHLAYQKIMIRCFVHNTAEDADNDNCIKDILMWAHYANSHKGICIKYKFSHSMLWYADPIKKITNRLLRVYYNKNTFSLKNDSISIKEAFLLKHPTWAYENEVRLIDFSPENNCDYKAIPLDKDSYIDSIYFGYKCIDSDIHSIKLLAGDKVSYYKAELNPNNIFDLNFYRI